MEKVSVFVDGFNLYHAIDSLKKPHLKWVNIAALAKEFAKDTAQEIIRIKFFTAPPIHKSQEVQERYFFYTQALKYHGVEIIEGKFKRKIITFHDGGGKSYTRTAHEEKETDVNLALAILEDAYEKISDKILVITNDSDISPAIRMARKKNQQLKINVITPPLIKTKRANYDLVDACGDVTKNKQGQVFYKTRMIKEIHLERNLLPDEMVMDVKKVIKIPVQYAISRKEIK